MSVCSIGNTRIRFQVENPTPMSKVQDRSDLSTIQLTRIKIQNPILKSFGEKFQNFWGLGPKDRIWGLRSQNLQKHVFSHISTKNNAMIVVEGLLETYW